MIVSDHQGKNRMEELMQYLTNGRVNNWCNQGCTGNGNIHLFSVAWQIGYKRTREIVEASTVEQVIYDLYEPRKEVCGCEHIQELLPES